MSLKSLHIIASRRNTKWHPNYDDEDVKNRSYIKLTKTSLDKNRRIMVRLNKSIADVWENMRITTTLLFVQQLVHSKTK